MATRFDDEKLKAVSEAIRAVAHPVRLKIIDLLADGEKNVGQLCETLQMPQPYVSQQLAILRYHRVLEARREAQQIFYSVANPHVIKIIQCVRDQAAVKPEIDQNKGGNQHE